MPCLLAAIALAAPRLLVAYLFFFTEWLQVAFHGVLIWPILGFLFAPTTLLWYSVVQNYFAGQWGVLQIVVMVVAILIDLSPGSSFTRRRYD